MAPSLLQAHKWQEELGAMQSTPRLSEEDTQIRPASDSAPHLGKVSSNSPARSKGGFTRPAPLNIWEPLSFFSACPGSGVFQKLRG